MTETNLKNDYDEENGNELGSFNNKKEFKGDDQFYNHQRVKDYSDDYKHSLVFLITGIFLWLPFFFNLIFFKSPNIQARKFSVASLILGTVYFISIGVPLTVIYIVTYQNKRQYENNGYHY
ncbi:hypothetical protein ACTA71_010278 [Dictyostelium dimigraforme]